MRAEFDFGVSTEAGTDNSDDPMSPRLQRQRLGRVSRNKLVAFLGYVGLGDPRTEFLVYSRGWSESLREEWVREVEGRFPRLRGRVFTISVPGREKATFREIATARTVRQKVERILGLRTEGQGAAQ